VTKARRGRQKQKRDEHLREYAQAFASVDVVGGTNDEQVDNDRSVVAGDVDDGHEFTSVDVVGGTDDAEGKPQDVPN